MNYILRNISSCSSCLLSLITELFKLKQNKFDHYQLLSNLKINEFQHPYDVILDTFTGRWFGITIVGGIGAYFF